MVGEWEGGDGGGGWGSERVVMVGEWEVAG